MKSKIFISLNLFFVCLSCYSEDIIIEFPNNRRIREYVSCEIIITSVRNGETITPSYELTLLKNMPNYIKELEVQVTYYYGQNFDYINSSKFILNKEEIEEFNTNGVIYIKKFLPEMERESLEKKKNSVGYVDPDGEYINEIFYKLVVEK
jgi:hypothetical protein